MKVFHFFILFSFVLVTINAYSNVCGTQMLQKLKIDGVVKNVHFKLKKLKSVRNEYEIGDKRDFWTYDLSVMPPKNIKKSATCRGKGEHLYVFVADDVWGSKVSEDDVNKIVEAFDVKSKIDNGKGIYENDVSTFGDPPDVDGDPRITIFIYEIGMYQGYSFDGFFRIEDEGPFNPQCESNPQIYCSNETEMIHINAKNPGSDYMLGVIAHEFQHMIHFNYDPYEESWINEAMSEVAMVINGYSDNDNLKAYIYNNKDPLVTAQYVSYGAVLLFGTYVYDRFGQDFIKTLVENKKRGIDGFDDSLTEMGISEDFVSVFNKWSAANFVQNSEIDNGVYGYKSITFPEFPVHKSFYANSSLSVALSVPPYSFKIFRIYGFGMNIKLNDKFTVKIDNVGDFFVVLNYGSDDVSVLESENGEVLLSKSLNFSEKDEFHIVIPNPSASALNTNIHLEPAVEEVVESGDKEEKDVYEENGSGEEVDAINEDVAGKDAVSQDSKDENGNEEVSEIVEKEEEGASSSSSCSFSGFNEVSTSLGFFLLIFLFTASLFFLKFRKTEGVEK